MLASSALDVDFASSLAVTLGVLVSMFATGLPLVPRAMMPERDLMWLSLVLANGLFFLSGIAITILLGRFGFHSLVPIVQIAHAAWHWRRKVDGGLASSGPAIRLVFPVALAAGACVVFVHWWSSFQTSDGAVRNLHSDLGYFAQLALGMHEAHHASLWAGVLGTAVEASGGPLDVWYHWGPVWFASAVHELTGLPVMVALLHVGETVFTFLLVLAAGSIVEALTSWRTGRCLLAGGVSIMAVPFMKMFGVLHLTSILPYGVLQHHRASLLMQLPYKIDALLLLLALSAWLRKRDLVAAVLLFLGGISSPHSVAGGGVMAGTLLVVGLLLRRKWMWKTAAAICAILLSSWLVLALGFKVNLPKSSESDVLTFGFESIRFALRAGVIDAVIGSVLCAILLPGIIHLLRAREGDEPAERPRLLGWMAVCGLAGSFAAFHLFNKMGDRFHFTMFTHVVLVLPAGIWGLARLASKTGGWSRVAGITIIIASGLMGLVDLVGAKTQTPRCAWSAGEMRTVELALGGQPFGYFATTDRDWWISKHSTLASLMGVRCVRLNDIATTGRKNVNTAFYGAGKPGILVPPIVGETAEQWSLRFARRLGIRFVLEIGAESVPASIKESAELIATTDSFRVYRLPVAE